MSVDGSETSKPAAPFAGLLATSSLILAVLLVAGFSYRWTYYYNFGLKDLAIQAPVESIAISALELIRTPSDMLTTLLIVGTPLLLLNLSIAALDASVRRRGADASSRLARLHAFSGLGNPFVIDLARALVLIYAAYWAGSEAGLKKFVLHVSETPQNALPKVTIVTSEKSRDAAPPFECAAVDWHAAPAASAAGRSRPVLGSQSAVAAFQNGLACNVAGYRSWRLLYRDDKFIYLFATGKATALPPTLILPSSDQYFLVLQGLEAGHAD